MEFDVCVIQDVITSAGENGIDPVEAVHDYLANGGHHLQLRAIKDMIAEVIHEVGFAKRITVESLPDGYYRERLMMIAESPSALVWVVAKPGTIGDWACYIGWPNKVSSYGVTQDDSGYYRRELTNRFRVVQHGDKVTEETARVLFPNMTGHYRR